MKLKIMIMALLLLAGIGSAVNRLPATEFVGDMNLHGYPLNMGGGDITSVLHIYTSNVIMESLRPNIYVYKNDTSVTAYSPDGNVIATGAITTDDDTVLDAAIAYSSSGRIILATNSYYGITANLTGSQSICGMGANIYGDGTNDVITLSGAGGTLSDMTIIGTENDTDKFFAINISGDYASITDVNIYQGNSGVNLCGTVAFLEKMDIRKLADDNAGGTGILISGGNDHFLSNIIISGTSTLKPYGIEITDASGLVVQSVDIMMTAHDLYMHPTSGNIMAAYFDNCMFDVASGNCIKMDGEGQIEIVHFSDCWICSAYGHGINMLGDSGSIRDILFSGCTIFNNGVAGAQITIGDRITFDSCMVGGNNYRDLSARQNAAGIAATSITNLSITDSRISNKVGEEYGATGHQDYGVYLASCRNVLLADNDLAGNLVSNVYSTGTSLSHVRNNLGYVTENSGSSTGTGAEQTIPHGLASTPKLVSVSPTVTGATASWWHDATNIYPTVTLGKTFTWYAST